MMRNQSHFPLVADDELVVGQNPQMELYDEMDLISNIKGPYQEKFIGTPVARQEEQTIVDRNLEEDLLPPLFEAHKSPYSRRERKHSNSQPKAGEKTQGQLAREAAREDLKKKRSAAYLQDEKPAPARVFKKSETPTVPIKVNSKETVSHLTHLADRLRQTDYILADMPAVYGLDKESREQQTPVKKNSYDFLRKSQVYNYPERRQQREHQLAQELNLNYMEEEK